MKKKSPETTKHNLNHKVKPISLFLFIFSVILICLFFVFNGPRKVRTLITLTYFVKSALASQNYQEKNFKNIPQPTTIEYSDGNSQTKAWIFKPNKTVSHSAIIISFGVGINDENKNLLIQTADNLRKSGITVLVPLPEDVQKDDITLRAIESYKNAFTFLEKQSYIDPKKIGFLGFCAGSDLLLVAATNNEISNKILFVASFSAYADINDFYSEVFSHHTIGSNSHLWIPNQISYNLALKGFSRGLLTKIKVENDIDKKFLDDILINGKLDRSKITGLSPQWQEIMTIITSRDPYFIRSQFPKFPAELLKLNDDISPINHVKNIKAPIFLIHDRNDDFEPVEESKRLADAFGPQAQFLETNILDHTILRNKIPIQSWLKEGPKIFSFLYKIFSKTS